MGDADAIAKTLKAEWEARARSENREFYVASHPGWNTAEGRAHQARSDATNFLVHLDPEVLRTSDLLEVGCGSGRLVPYIAPRVQSYTGIDISRTMVEVARRDCHEIANARFFEASGTELPEGARDRRYDIALSVAVFIHNPKHVCDSLARSAMAQLRVGGEFRVQLRADAADPEGITPGSDTATIERAQAVERTATPDQKDLILGTNYYGHPFGYHEAKTWLESLGDAQVYRMDPLFIYGFVKRRA